jgi:hypothetical protein
MEATDSFSRIPEGEPRLQELIEALRGIRRARVDLSEQGIESIRVLVVPEKSTEQALREVKDVVAAQLGWDLDPSTVEVLRTAEVKPFGSRRRRLTSITTERWGDRFTARVILELAGDLLVGEATAPAERRFAHRCVAQATLNGLTEILVYRVELDAVDVFPIGETQLATVSVTRADQTLVGSSIVHLDEYDAIARATLDALNRRIDALGGNSPELAELPL